jgi:hypothetical protein
MTSGKKRNSTYMGVLLLLFSLSAWLPGTSQTLSDDFIWNALYPGNRNFISVSTWNLSGDSEGKFLKRRSKNGGKELELHTRIEKIFFFEKAGVRKALVVLFSFEFDERTGLYVDCNGCSAEYEMAHFSIKNGTWILEKFIQNWPYSSGVMGGGSELDMKVYNKTNCLVVTTGYLMRGEYSEVISFYEIETLKLIKMIEKEYNQPRVITNTT